MKWVAAVFALFAALAAGRICGSAPVQKALLYHTEVTLSSLDCDVVMWRRIFFHNERGTVVAEADSGPPLVATEAGCVVHFSADLPRAMSYVLDNGTRRSAPISFDELKADSFQMNVRLR